MSRYEALLFVHIVGAMIWLGGALFLQIYAISVNHGGDPQELGLFASRVGRLSERIFVPASLVVVLAGIGLMLDGSWQWGRLWVVFALVTFAGSFVTGVFVLGPLAKRLGAAGPETAEGRALLARLFRISRVDLVFMYAIVFAMVVKPTSDDGWVVLGAAAVLVLASAFFLAPRRADAVEGSAALTD